MADVTIRVEGEDAVARALHAIAEYVEDPADALDEIGEAGVGVVRRRIPRDTGAAQGSARANRRRNTTRIEVGVDYAGPLNAGVPSRNMAPVHFIEDGQRDLEPLAVRLLEDGINQTIRKQGLSR